MPEIGTTALLLPVPGAEALLREVAAAHPAAVRAGVPAHVTVLYPFLPVSEVDDAVLARLRGLFAAAPPPEVSFALPAPEGGFVALRPEPLSPVRQLVRRVRSCWPHLVPYRGEHGPDVDPHLTVAMDLDPAEARDLAAGLSGRMPPPARLDEAWLTAFDGEWSVRERMPLGRAQ